MSTSRGWVARAYQVSTNRWRRAAVRVRGGRVQRRGDQAARLGRVDDVVDLEELGGVERLGVLLRGGGDLAGPARSRSSSSSIASSSLRRPSRTAPSRPIGPRCAPGQATVSSGSCRLPPDHRLRAEAVAAAQDHRDQRHLQRGAGHQQPGGARARAPAPRRRARPCSPGVSTSDTTGRPNASHSCRKRAALSDAAARDRARHHHGVVGEDADRRARRCAPARSPSRVRSVRAGTSPSPRRPASR